MSALSPAFIVSTFLFATAANVAGLFLVLIAIQMVSVSDQPKGLLAWRQAILDRLQGRGLGRKPLAVGIVLWMASLVLSLARSRIGSNRRSP